MADKFCDHGAYSEGVFTGSRSGTTVTITAVTSGKLGLGSHLYGTSIQDGTYITALGTGVGGTGTYTTNTTGTVASTTITGRYGNPLNVPLVWAEPQEGDGTASTPATASATVAIDLSAATAAAGATVSIMGATLTCVASGAGNNQFNAGSGATLVSNLVTAINRTTNTSVLVAQAAGWATPKVQDAVFARIGTPTTTLEIMTRAGSAQYNTSQVVTSGLTGGTFGPYTFSGGSGGCWGYLVNWGPSTIWPSGVAANTYGLWGDSTPQMAGVPDDVVHIRSGKVLYGGRNASNGQIQFRSMGTQFVPVRFIIDDSTVWADGVDPVLSIVGSIAYGLTLGAGGAFTVNTFMRFEAKQYASGVRNLSFTNTCNGAITIVLGQGFDFRNVHFENLINTYGLNLSAGYWSPAPNAASLSSFVDCKFVTRANTSMYSQNAATAAVEFVGCVFESHPSVVVPNAGVLGTTASVTGSAELSFEGCSFEGFVAPSKLWADATGVTYPFNSLSIFQFRNCDFGNVSSIGPIMSLSLTGRSGVSEYARVSSAISTKADRMFFIDNQFGMVSYVPDRVAPTLFATKADGTTAWSWEVVPAVVATMLGFNSPLKTPRIGRINSLADGARTFTVEFMPEDTVNYTKRDVALFVQYEDTTGALRRVDSFDIEGAALDVSTAGWTSTSFPANGTTHVKRKITLSTLAGFPLKEGTEVSAYMAFYTVGANITKRTIVDPTVVIA